MHFRIWDVSTRPATVVALEINDALCDVQTIALCRGGRARHGSRVHWPTRRVGTGFLALYLKMPRLNEELAIAHGSGRYARLLAHLGEDRRATDGRLRDGAHAK